MKPSSRRIRRVLWLGAAASAALALTVSGVTSSVAAQPLLPGAASHKGPGYPPPGGIYTPFTDCPIANPLMQETPLGSDPAATAGSFAACSAGDVTSGTLKIGNITTPVVQPVNVQFGFFSTPNGASGGDNNSAIAVLPPPGGLSAMVVSKPDLVPGSLTTALGCPSSNPTVEHICREAQQRGGRFQQIFGLAQEAGQLTNFNLLAWTQRLKVHLINPLLGKNCFIGTDQNPIVVNPVLSIGPGSTVTTANDPNPAKHPDIVVISIANATASDSTFSAPAVTGCGPGGQANIAVDEALDTSGGLPAASGSNSLTLNGTFAIADSFPESDPSLAQPPNNALNLLSAFKASAREPDSGIRAAVHRMSSADLRLWILHRLGLK